MAVWSIMKEVVDPYAKDQGDENTLCYVSRDDALPVGGLPYQ